MSAPPHTSETGSPPVHCSVNLRREEGVQRVDVAILMCKHILSREGLRADVVVINEEGGTLSRITRAVTFSPSCWQSHVRGLRSSCAPLKRK